MNYILIIKGVTDTEYQRIKADLTEQYQAKNQEVPFFAWIPQDYAEIDILWVDEEVEKDNFKASLASINVSAESVNRDFNLMRMLNEL